MEQVKAKALISYVDQNLYAIVKNYRIFKLFNGKESNSYADAKSAKRYLSQLTITLNNASINTINLLPKPSDDSKSKTPSSSNPKPHNIDSKNKDIVISIKNEICKVFHHKVFRHLNCLSPIGNDYNVCRINLGGFNYNKLNPVAYKFLTICIDSLYRQAIELADNPEKQEEANKLLIQLLQPIEQISTTSKNLGIYAVQKEMMYRQKKLDYYIAKTNFNQSISTIKTDFPQALLTSDILSWYGSLISHVFQDLTYGYGFKRLRIFWIIFFLITLNFFLALFVSYQKQKDIACLSLYLKTREIEDEDLINKTKEKNYLKLGEVSSEIDSIQQIIFDTYEKNERGSLIFNLYLKMEGDDYKKIQVDEIDFSYLVDIIDKRSPNHTKIGFCKNYYPKGNWSVVTHPEFLHSMDPKKRPNKIDIYFINEQKLVKEIKFEAINPIQSLLNLISIPLKYLTPSFRAMICWGNSLLDKTKMKFYFKKVKDLFLALSAQESTLGNFLLILESVLAPIILFLMAVLLVLAINLIPNFILNSTPPCVIKIINNIIWEMRIIIPISLFFLLLYEILHFWRRRVDCQEGGVPLVAKKNLMNALLFSIDLLVPIIELDKENLDFILEAANVNQWISLYFLSEKLIGPALIGVLIPILLATSL
ncbi:MAG: hypothetical protein ACK58N_16525 [Synechocystis sp.]